MPKNSKSKPKRKKVVRKKSTAKKSALRKRKPTKPRKKPKKKKRTLTTSDRQNALDLADRLGKIAPLSSHFKGSFSLKKVITQEGLGRYLPKKSSNKTEAISKFVENMMVYKPRTLKKVMRIVLPQAIKKRHQNGDPVLKMESEELANALGAVGCDMRKEISELKLPEDRPKVVPPPPGIQKMLKDFRLHPNMMPDCEKMFLDGHLNESVRKALEKFETHIQQLSGRGHGKHPHGPQHRSRRKGLYH